MLETGHGQVWAGSHNSVVYVIDNSRDVIAVTDTLLAHAHKVVAMTTTASNRYFSVVGRLGCRRNKRIIDALRMPCI